MTDNEIIKALECCNHNHVWQKECFDCEYATFEGQCGNELIKDALDLINRQKAEIDALRKTILDADYSSITALKAKESWHMENSIYIYQLNERIDRLQADNSSMQSTLAKMSMGVEQAKSEAIKEFAERLKAEQSFYDGQETRIYLTEKDLDNLLKEMVGDAE